MKERVNFMSNEKRVQQAVDAFMNGKSCSQAVFCVYGPALGIAEEAALRISGAFGGDDGTKLCHRSAGGVRSCRLHAGRDAADGKAGRPGSGAGLAGAARQPDPTVGRGECRWRGPACGIWHHMVCGRPRDLDDKCRRRICHGADMKAG